MQWGWIKGLVLSSFVLSLASLDAGSCSSNKKPEDKLQHQEMRERRSPPPPPMHERKVSGEIGMKMPASHGCSSNEGFLLYVDYLIMRAYNSDVVFAAQKVAFEEPGAFLNRVVEGQMINPIRTWKPGFRVGLGWNTPFDLWDIRSDWTYYYNKSITNKAMPDILLSSALQNQEEGFSSYWATPLTSNGTVRDALFQNLQGTWQLNYNMVDLELGRSLYITKALALRPHFGVQNGWIHQKIDVQYSRSFFDSTPVTDVIVAQNVTVDNNFWGIGFRAGFDTEWQLGAGFSFIGKIAGSLLSGRTTTRRVQGTNLLNAGEFLRAYNIRDRITLLSPSLQTTIGLSWGCCLNEAMQYLGLSFAWESNYWWNQFKFLQPNLPSVSAQNNFRGYSERYPFSDGALYMEGGVVRGRFDF